MGVCADTDSRSAGSGRGRVPLAVVGAVLAGGQSSRMGRDKALIVVEGLPLAARTANVLATAGCTNVCLVGRQHTLSGLDWPVIADHGTGYHPLAGVAAVLSRYPAGLVLVAPCDLVNLSATHITALLQHGGPCVASTGRPDSSLTRCLSRLLRDDGERARDTRCSSHAALPRPPDG